MNNDLISRSALLENYGLKNAVKYGNETAEQQHNSYSTLMLYEVADMIMDAPAVDAVEVVRCVNCVWYCEWRTKPGVFLCGRPNNGGLVVKPDFFCKHGERKEVENGKSN